jgi:tRNA threonylcarbamoyladenosine biosynthesis protein TsaE
MKEKVYREENLADLAKEVVSLLSEKIRDGRASVLFLEGDLGAGKTTFTKRIAETLGVKEDVTSPTFTIMHKYKTRTGPWENLFHIDAYRLTSSKELEILNIKEDLKNKNSLFVFEWPSNISGEIIPDLEIKLSHQANEKERKVSF